ncbi:MAG: hypothetical protein AAB602_01595 [Patescibacteria group bacterium]
MITTLRETDHSSRQQPTTFRVQILPGGKLPQRAGTEPGHAVGYDVFTRDIVVYNMSTDDPRMRQVEFDLEPPEVFRLGPGGVACLGTGVVIEIPHGFAGWIKPRGSTVKNGVAVLNQDVPIDPDFRGEPIAVIRNEGRAPFDIRRHQRIVQIVFTPVALPILEEVLLLDKTTRGNGSHGSTGK